MELLTAELRAQLPALYESSGGQGMMIYARFSSADGKRVYYAAEGQEEGDKHLGISFEGL